NGLEIGVERNALVLNLDHPAAHDSVADAESPETGATAAFAVALGEVGAAVGVHDDVDLGTVELEITEEPLAVQQGGDGDLNVEVGDGEERTILEGRGAGDGEVVGVEAGGEAMGVEGEGADTDLIAERCRGLLLGHMQEVAVEGSGAEEEPGSQDGDSDHSGGKGERDLDFAEAH